MSLPLTQNQIAQLVNNPSLGALTYQACSLLEALSRIRDRDYPLPAQRIRDVLRCWTEYVLDQTWELYPPEDPLGIRGGDFERVRKLGVVLRQLYSNVRYLRASGPSRAPSSLQVALNELARLHYPKKNGEYVCVVRPQWKYNLKYISLSEHLKNISPLDLLDPNWKLGLQTEDELLPALWLRSRGKLSPAKQRKWPKKPPKHLAILSFPGLDTKDSLLYPLLAHELGHFIDSSYSLPLHRHGSLIRTAEIKLSTVRKTLKRSNRHTWPDYTEKVWLQIQEFTLVCIRELLADLMATRIMGLSFFISQAEFLKTVSAWEQPTIDLTSGYPSIRLRLSSIYNHLVLDRGPENLLLFLKRHSNEEPEITSFLVDYLEEWGRLLGTPREVICSSVLTKRTKLENALAKLVEDAVLNSLGGLTQAVKKGIPERNRARLTPVFFERIRLLRKRRTPRSSPFDTRSFAEIMSAAWVYQLGYGEWSEIKKTDPYKQRKFYDETCQLVLKAIGYAKNRGGS